MPLVVINVNFYRSGFVYIHIPEVQALIRVGYVLAVGRPRGAVEKRWRIAEIDLANITQSILRAQVKRVLAGLV